MRRSAQPRPAGGNESALLLAAKRGEEEGFISLTSPHRHALHLHCYRLLGSLHDADDALQETLLNAWRALPDYEPIAPLRAWLYRIATNVALRMIERRREPTASVDAHLQPYPDCLFSDVPAEEASPEEEAILAESVGLALVAAMQLLPPKQRAVLVLRDALGWQASEVADLLGDTVPAVNSVLQRARAKIAREQEAGALARTHAPANRTEEARVIGLFQEAWANVDIPGIVALLTDDALLTMPPVAMRFTGAQRIGEFFATEPVGGRLDHIDLVEVRANGQPAFASYADEDGDGTRSAYGVMVLALQGDQISGITGFPRDVELFGRLGLPPSLGSGERR